MRNLVLKALLLLSACATAEPGRRQFGYGYQAAAGEKVKVAFFDADSTLRIAPSGSVSANASKDVWILPLVSAEIARLNREGYLVAIVSNQGGVPKSVSLEDADSALDFVRKMVAWLNPEAKIHYYDFAEHKDRDRKPQVGMLERVDTLLKERFGAAGVDKEKSFLVGDSAYKKGQLDPQGRPGQDFSDSDRGVAERYGIPFVDPADFFGWRKYGVDRFHSKKEIDLFFEKHPELKGKPLGPCPFPSLLPKS